MSQKQRPKKKTWLSRAILQNGETGVAIGIPAEARDGAGGLEPGEGGDKADLEYNREDNTLTVFLPDNRGDDE